VPFWEICFRRTYHAFTHCYLGGEDNLLWWLRQVDERHLLRWIDLSPGALCAILASAPPSSEFYLRTTGELQRRHLPEPDLGQEIIAFERPNYCEAILRSVMQRTDPGRAPLGQIAIRSLFLVRLTEFISRFYIIEMDPAAELAGQALAETYQMWDYGSPVSFESDLLRRTLGQMPRFHPEKMPAVLPGWFEHVSLEEQAFLRRTLVVERMERLILFLVVYAATTPWEIAPAVSGTQRRLAPRQIEILLIRAWRMAFDVL
jgi:hypothetical protein